MIPWGRGWRNFGWYCKGRFCEKPHKAGGVPLYECKICGPDGEFCGVCATKNGWKCNVGHPLRRG